MDNFVELSQKLPVIEKISKFGDQWIGLIKAIYFKHPQGQVFVVFKYKEKNIFFQTETKL